MTLKSLKCCCCPGCDVAPGECCQCVTRMLCVELRMQTPVPSECECRPAWKFGIAWDCEWWAWVGAISCDNVWIDLRIEIVRTDPAEPCRLLLTSDCLGICRLASEVELDCDALAGEWNIDLSECWPDCGAATLTVSKGTPEISPTNCAGCRCVCRELCIRYEDSDVECNETITALWNPEINAWEGDFECVENHVVVRFVTRDEDCLFETLGCDCRIVIESSRDSISDPLEPNPHFAQCRFQGGSNCCEHGFFIEWFPIHPKRYTISCMPCPCPATRFLPCGPCEDGLPKTLFATLDGSGDCEAVDGDVIELEFVKGPDHWYGTAVLSCGDSVEIWIECGVHSVNDYEIQIRLGMDTFHFGTLNVLSCDPVVMSAGTTGWGQAPACCESTLGLVQVTITE